MQTFSPRDLDELIEYSLSVLNGWDEIKRIELSEQFNYNIIIKGQSWDGQFDQRISHIVTNVHKAIIAIYAESQGKSIRSANSELKKINFRVIAKVEDGSADIKIEILEFLKGIFNNMTAEQQLIGLTILTTGTVGFLGIKGVINYLHKKNELLHEARMKELSNEDRRALLEASNNSILEAVNLSKNNNNNVQKAVEAVRDVISETDEIYVPSRQTPVSKQDIIESTSEIIFETPKTYYIDDEFLIREWMHYDSITGVIEAYGIRLKHVNISLNDNDKEKLATLVNTLEKVKLQVTIEVENGKPNNVQIIGLGEAREDSVALNTIIQ